MKKNIFLAIIIVSCQSSKEPQSPNTPPEIPPIELPPSDDNNGGEKNREELIEEIDELRNPFYDLYQDDKENYIYLNSLFLIVQACKNFDVMSKKELEDKLVEIKNISDLRKWITSKLIVFYKSCGIWDNEFSIEVDINKFIDELLAELAKTNKWEQIKCDKKDLMNILCGKENDKFYKIENLKNVFDNLNKNHSCNLECDENSANDIKSSVNQFIILKLRGGNYYSKDSLNFQRLTEGIPKVKTGDKYDIVSCDCNGDDGNGNQNIKCTVCHDGKYYEVYNYKNPAGISFFKKVKLVKGTFIGK